MAKVIWVSVFVAVIFSLAGLGASCLTKHRVTTSLDDDHWQCTASRIVKDNLPREEQCTQYTRKEKQK